MGLPIKKPLKTSQNTTYVVFFRALAGGDALKNHAFQRILLKIGDCRSGVGET